MKIPRNYIIVFIAGIVILILFEYFKPQPVNWEISLSSDDKSPYGTYVIHESLEDLFRNRSISDNSISLYEFIDESKHDAFGFISISEDFKPDKNSLDKLLKHVAKGNTAFISAMNFHSALLDSLNIKIKNRFYAKNEDQKLLLEDYSAGADDFSIEYSIEKTFDSIGQSQDIAILGTNARWQANFIRIPYGKGYFLLHSSPLAFSNYHILKGDTKAYIEHIFSKIQSGNIVWHDRKVQDTFVSSSPLRYILSEYTLRAAYYLLLITALLFLVFASKRLQSAIPVIRKAPDRSFHFITSVSRLYLYEGNHKVIALKKIRHFKAFLKEKFFLRELNFSKEDSKLIGKKARYEEKDVIALFALIRKIMSLQRIPAETLMDLNRKIVKFKNHTENH